MEAIDGFLWEGEAYFTNASMFDTDIDGLEDGEEVIPGADNYITNANDSDTDDDGLKDGAEEAIKAVMANRSKTEEVLTAWRKTEIPDEDVRNKLRQSCPSQRRRENLETEIARRLIDDQALYARALNLSAPTHEARYK